MKLHLVDENGKTLVRDKKPVIVEVRDEVQAAAFLKQGFKLIEEAAE